MNKNTEQFLKQNVLFGLIIGATFIVASLLFILAGKSIVMNPQLNNIMMMLTIFGVFIGIKKYRDEQLSGIISYGKALSTGIFILSMAALLYSIYMFILYTFSPDLMAEFKKIMLTSLKVVYQDTPFYKIIEESFTTYLYPISIAFGELFNKILIGAAFTLFIAGLVRRSTPINPQQF